MELLRLVSMLYIVFYHFSFRLQDGMASRTIGAVFHIGVICFVMISGYFGIRPTPRKFLNLAGTIWFYMFACRLAGILIGGGICRRHDSATACGSSPSTAAGGS